MVKSGPAARLRRGNSDLVHLLSQTKKGRDWEPLSEDEQVLLVAWNDHPYVAGQQKPQKRNKTTLESELFNDRWIVRTAIKRIGLEALVSSMELYLTACKQKKHIRGNHNHAVLNLVGFLNSMVRYNKEETIPWWMVDVTPLQDDHIALTENIADAFAGQFLGRQSFGLQNPSTDYEHFMKAGDWVKRLCAATPGQWSEDDVVKYLMDCLARQYDGKTVVPGHTDSDHTWGTLMPQHLKQIMGA